jgi:hypothetical protein
MKKIYSLLLLLMATTGFGQKFSNLVVFSDDASLFHVYVNGIKQNIEAKSNVKITGLTNPNLQVTVQFADAQKGILKKNLAFAEMGVEATMKITYTKNGYKLRYFGEVPIAEASNADVSQYTTTYTTTETVTTTTTTTPVTTNTTTTTTTPVNTTTNNTTSTTAVTTNTTATTNISKKDPVNLNYSWTAGAVYKFATTQIDDVTTSMMGMNMKDKFTTSTEFGLHILSVATNGTASGYLYLIDYKVSDSKGTVLASINDIPADMVMSDITVDKKGKFTFPKKLSLITSPTGNVLAYAKADGNGVALGGQAGDVQVDAYAEFDPKTGSLKTSYKVTELKTTKKVTVKITEETDQLEVLPYDYLELLALPDGAVSQGEKSSMRSGIYSIEIVTNKIENGIAQLNYTMKTDKSKDLTSGDAKVTDSGGNTQMDMNSNQMFDMNSVMTDDDKNAMGMAKDMSPEMTCDMTSEFAYDKGMFSQVTGVMTTKMNTMGLQMSVVSNLTMKKL